MGQVSSSALPPKEEILRKTRGGRDIVNMVFDYMVRKTTLRELYSLANPEECKKYIFLTADALDVMFKRIDLEPREKDKGRIYFQKVEELTKPHTSDDPRGKQRKVICLKLAFLYIRIFQIFASLALSVLDVETETDVKFYEELSRLRGFEEDVPLFGRRPLRGGADGVSSSWPQEFEPLKPYLQQIPGYSQYYRLGSLYIATGASVNGKKAVIYEFTMPKKRAAQRVEAQLSVLTYNPNAYVLRLTEVKDPEGSMIPDLGDIRFARSRIIDPFMESAREMDKATGKEKRVLRTIPEAIKYRLKLVAMKKYEDTADEVYRADVYDTKGYGPAASQGYAPGRDTYAPTRDTYGPTGAVREGLHTKVLMDALKQTRPVKAHCIARALQLLGTDGLKSAFPPQIYSNICTAKFLTDNKSLPGAEERITSEHGIYALAQLFYDMLGTNAPEISAATRAQYNDFIKKMKFVFEDVKASQKEPTTLDDVKNRMPSVICDQTTINKPMKIENRELIRQMRIYARKMIDYQVNHVANVVKVLRKLFLIPVKQGMSLQIHPNVAKYGIEEVNRVGEEARNLLIEYYSQCEGMYRQAVEVVGQNKKLVKV
jgi:hypothetical protein